MIASYSLQNAERYGWDSVHDKPIPEREDLLTRWVVGPRVLDAGCGGGGVTAYLRQLGFEATGTDAHRLFLDRARKRGPDMRFVEGDVSSLPFSSNSFDSTVCLDVLEHVDNDRRAVAELARVTTRRLVIAVPQELRDLTRYRVTPSTFRDQTHRRYYTVDSLTALLSDLGAAKIVIFGEQTLLIRRLALDLLEPRSRFSFATPVYRRLLRFLVLRTPEPPVHMNLAAIVELAASH